MKLIIAGSRGIEVSPSFITELVFQNKLNIKELVNGLSYGIDESARLWFKKINDREHGVYFINGFDYQFRMELKEFPADWKAHGKAAGPIRNRQMAEYADALLLIWDGKSKGSANMKKEMLKLKKPVYEVILRNFNVK